MNDGAYSAEAGFGYTGTAGTLRNSNASIYESMRYASGTNSITYRFDNPDRRGLHRLRRHVQPHRLGRGGKTRLADIKDQR